MKARERASLAPLLQVAPAMHHRRTQGAVRLPARAGQARGALREQSLLTRLLSWWTPLLQWRRGLRLGRKAQRKAALKALLGPLSPRQGPRLWLKKPSKALEMGCRHYSMTRALPSTEAGILAPTRSWNSPKASVPRRLTHSRQAESLRMAYPRISQGVARLANLFLSWFSCVYLVLCVIKYPDCPLLHLASQRR